MDPTYGVNHEKTSFIGLDPGLTTGWALLDQGGKLLGSGDFTEAQLRDGLDELVRGCHRSDRVVHVVIERMPPGEAGELARRLEWVRGVINEVIADVYELPTSHVRPGEWKNSRVAKITRWPDGMSVHARDAATMALYVMDKEVRRAQH